MKTIHHYQTKTTHTMKPSRPGLTHCLPVVLLLWSTCWLLTGCGIGKRSHQQFMLGQDPAEPVITSSDSGSQACKVPSDELSQYSREETFQQFFKERRAEDIWNSLYSHFNSDYHYQSLSDITDARIYDNKYVKGVLDKYNPTTRASLQKAISTYIAIKQKEAAFRNFLRDRKLDEVWFKLIKVKSPGTATLDLRWMLRDCNPEQQSYILERVVQFILNYCPHVVNLDLSDNRLISLPDSLGKLTQLQVLNLKASSSGNYETQLPFTFAFQNVLNLPVVNINANPRETHLTELPDTFGNLTNLHTLDLSGNHLTRLPDFFVKLTQLQILDLSDNWLTTLPDWLHSLANLKDLRLINNPIKGPVQEIPFRELLNNNDLAEMWNTLQSAKTNQQNTLNLSRKLDRCVPQVQTDVLQGVFQFIQDYLPDLTILDLSFNQLTQLPDNIGELRKLQKLVLSNNQLQALPATLGNLTQLQILDLPTNHLQGLPDSFVNLEHLRSLNLFENHLIALPVCLASLTQLQLLNLGFNHVAQFPLYLANLTQLRILDLENNQLTQFPVCFENLTQLQTLNLSKNQLTQFPACLANFTQLQALNLSDNQLTQFPAFLANLTQLQTLNLSNNQLTQLPACLESFTKLERLCVHNNQLTYLPGCLQKLTNWRMFRVENNPLVQPNAGITEISKIGVELTINNLYTLLSPSLCELAGEIIVRQRISYETKPIPQDCINAIQHPNKTYRVMLFIKQLGNLTLDEIVPIVTQLSYQEIRRLVHSETKVILMN